MAEFNLGKSSLIKKTLRIITVMILATNIASCGAIVRYGLSKPQKAPINNKMIKVDDLESVRKEADVPIRIFVLSNNMIDTKKMARLLGITYGIPFFSFDELFITREKCNCNRSTNASKKEKQCHCYYYEGKAVTDIRVAKRAAFENMQLLIKEINEHGSSIFHITENNVEKMAILNKLIKTENAFKAGYNIIIHFFNNNATNNEIAEIANKCEICSFIEDNDGKFLPNVNKRDKDTGIYIVDMGKSEYILESKKIQTYLECMSYTRVLDVDSIPSNYCNNNTDINRVKEAEKNRNKIIESNRDRYSVNRTYIITMDIPLDTTMALNKVINYIDRIILQKIL